MYLIEYTLTTPLKNVEPCRIELMISPDKTVTLDNVISYVMEFDPLHM